jgi:hypothetical protein
VGASAGRVVGAGADGGPAVVGGPLNIEFHAGGTNNNVDSAVMAAMISVCLRNLEFELGRVGC